MYFSLERDQLLGKGEIVLVCPAYLFAQLILGFMSFPEAPAKVEIRSFRTRYGGRRDGGGLRGEGVVAEVAAPHAAELDVTVMLQVGVGKPAKKVLEMPEEKVCICNSPSPEYDEQGEVPDDPGHQHFAGVEDGAADEDDVDYDGHDGAEHRGPDVLRLHNAYRDAPKGGPQVV